MLVANAIRSDMDTIPCQHLACPDQERRRHQRFDLRLPARVEDLSRFSDQAPVVLDLTTKDISAFGAYFPSSRSFQKGTRVKVDLILSPEKPKSFHVKRALIEVIGTVLRQGPEGMAVDFEKRYRLTPLNYA